VLENLTIANGYSNIGAIGGGVTLQSAQATFINVTFNNNAAGASGSGGGLGVFSNSIAFVFNSTFTNNNAVIFGGGIEVGDNSKLYIHNSQFTGNRVNLPNHSNVSSGGAIHLANSLLRITNSRFDSNQSGYSGGAIYVIGSWTEPVSTPRSDVIIANSLFINNKSFRDPTVSLAAPTEGGALHVESQTIAKIYNSRFINNSAMAGGAVTNYQAILEIDGCTFLGNYVLGSGSLGGYGGALGVSSNDTSADGSTNRRSATMTVKNSYFQGRYGTTDLVGWGGGAIYITGDVNRMYGLNGVSKLGTVAENRTKLIVDNVIFNDLDVSKLDGGKGGAITADLGDVNVQNSLFINLNASGTSPTGNYAAGGAVSAFNQSLLTITGSTFAQNSASKYGGAIFIQGASLELSNNTFFANEISPGVAEPDYESYGAAIFSAPGTFFSINFPVDGHVIGNKFLKNIGTALFDDDRSSGPINGIVYNNNQFYETTFSDKVYQDTLATIQNPSGLNSLVVTRQSGIPSTDKSLANDNQMLSSLPAQARLFAAPKQVLSTNAAGESAPPTAAYVAYAWYANAATLDGSSLANKTGFSSFTATGQHTLNADGTSAAVQVSAAPVPTCSTTLNGSNFTWNLSAGSFLDAVMNRGVTISSTASGSVTLPYTDRTYYLYIVTKEGGILKPIGPNLASLSSPANLYIVVGKNRTTNPGSLTIANMGTGILSWSASSSHPSLIQIQNPTGSTETQAAINLLIDASQLSLGEHTGYSIQVNAGDAGVITTSVTIMVVNGQAFLPIVNR
jgi:predicted outer membrane repeat protein